MNKTITISMEDAAKIYMMMKATYPSESKDMRDMLWDMFDDETAETTDSLRFRFEAAGMDEDGQRV